MNLVAIHIDRKKNVFIDFASENQINVRKRLVQVRGNETKQKGGNNKKNNRRLHSTHLFICSPFQMELVCFFFIFLSLLAPTSNQPKASNYVNFLANFIFLSQFQIHLCKVDFLESEIWREVWLALIHRTPLIFCLF